MPQIVLPVSFESFSRRKYDFSNAIFEAFADATVVNFTRDLLKFGESIIEKLMPM